MGKGKGESTEESSSWFVTFVFIESDHSCGSGNKLSPDFNTKRSY